MQSFKDNLGRNWEVSVDVTSVKRARRLLDLDIPRLLNDDKKPLGELLGDDVRLCDVLYVLCKDQADAKGISDEDFGRGMLGDAILHGRDAFLEALVDFFREPQIRAGLRKVIETARRVETKMMARLDRETARLDPETTAEELAEKLGATWAARSGKSSSIAPECSDSIPDRSPTTSWSE